MFCRNFLSCLRGETRVSLNWRLPGGLIVKIVCTINRRVDIGLSHSWKEFYDRQAYSYLRMSTDLQLKGDSRRRQLEASVAYAKAHNLELADDDQLEDIGVSAFKGINAREGALGKFLNAVKAGTIKPGSFLIVESLDRLSREEILSAQALFLSIIQSGINLVTLADNRVYQAGKTELADLIMSLMIMSRAHEESKIKSQRIGAAWENKRALAAAGQPMTKSCPAWLKLSSDRKRYEPISDRVGIIRQMFEDTASGVGMYSIVRRLNEAGTKAFLDGNGWHQSYVAKILSSRTVLGEFQPHGRTDGVRTPLGEPIENYYPAIIDRDLFFRAQNAKAERRVSGRGRKGPTFANLFSGLATCAYCPSKIVFENKGPGEKGGTYLICDSAKRHLGCKALRWSYTDFEASFLAFIEELDLESIINASDDAAKRKSIEDELAALHGELSSVKLALEQTYKALSAGGPVDFLTGKLNDLSARSAELVERADAKQAEQQQFEARESRFYKSREDIKALVHQLQSPATDELFKLRAQISARLRTLVETLLIAPLGSKPIMEKVIAELRATTNGEMADVISYQEKLADHPGQSRRYFAVGFRDAAVRAVFPKYGDPLEFEQQIVANDGSINASVKR